MEADKWVKIEKLYNFARENEKADKPRSGLFGKKCPKCGTKLNKDSMKELLAGESLFVNRFLKESSIAAGTYFISVNHYTCPKCKYESVDYNLEELSD